MKSFKEKKVLIFGLGLNQGGMGSAKFFAQEGANVKVTDLKSKEILKLSLDQLKEFNISYTLDEHRFEDIDWADLIIKNPAVKTGNPYITYALKYGKQVETDMGVFLRYVKPNQIIGVTGTKGKSTTASLIYETLKVAGKNVMLAGNIGKSVLELIPVVQKSICPPLGWQAKPKEVLIVLELSSFQLEAFDTHQVSPKWAVITNITPDHLNYYQNMDQYIQVKKVIGKYQTKDDFLFIRKDDSLVDKDKFLKGFKGQIICFSPTDLPKNFKPTLMGEHNSSNIAAAYQVGKVLNINSTLLLNSLANFKGVPFRMELIKEWRGVKIYNDTSATSPEAGIQAIKTASHLTSGNVVLICGGMNKGMDYTKYATIVGKFVKKIFFLEGDATDIILSSLRAQRSNLPTQGPYNDMQELLTDIKNIVKPCDIILFSPAATSFNLFQNEFDRGRKFNEAVKKVFV